MACTESRGVERNERRIGVMVFMELMIILLYFRLVFVSLS